LAVPRISLRAQVQDIAAAVVLTKKSRKTLQ
jgi:hypothetical protein